MIILAIETSCDDTCVAVLKIENCKLKILSNVVSSQVKLHAKYGGIYPFLAKREHQRNLPLVLKKALKKAGSPKINLIAVTVGPGLEPCLWVGVNFAIELAKELKTPIVPINHIEAHLLANFLNPKYYIQNTKYLFPAVCLVISGGHTQLILMKDIGKYRILGETRDDAAGECFDKAARILGLGYPGGPVIARHAQSHRKLKTMNLKLPRPMIYQKNYDFSFSGLKTAVLYNFRSQLPKVKKSSQYIRKMCAEVQQAVIDVLIHKTLRTTKDYKAKTIILGGGVAANDELRKQFQLAINNQRLAINFLVPPKNLCTDNAIMIATAGYFNRQKKRNWKEIEVNANLRIDEKA